MKTNKFFLRYKPLFVVAAFLLSASSMQAQTFTGQEKLTATPSSFEAIAYPAGPAAIRVNFNNMTAGGVSVIIRDEKGYKVYENLERVTAYRSRLDLSSLPVGKYTLELSKKGDQFIRSFTIEPPTAGFITMTTPSAEKTAEPVVNKKLITSIK